MIKVTLYRYLLLFASFSIGFGVEINLKQYDVQTDFFYIDEFVSKAYNSKNELKIENGKNTVRYELLNLRM